MAMRLQIIDPSAYTPPYDHALCSALAAAGAEVELVTSRFTYDEVAPPDGYERTELFYRLAHRSRSTHARAHTRASARTRAQLTLKLGEHVPDMVRCLRHAARADVVHFQWVALQQLDRLLIPPRPRPGRSHKLGPARSPGPGPARRRGGLGPLVLTAHDVLPREPRPGQLHATRRLFERFDAIVVHSEHGRGRLVDELGVDPSLVEVIPHGVFTHLTDTRTADLSPDLPPNPVTGIRHPRSLGAGEETPSPNRESASSGKRNRDGLGGPSILFFGLLRPYKGIDILLEAWRSIPLDRRGGATLSIAGMARMDLSPLRALAGDDVQIVPRFIGEQELPRWFSQADLVVLPYREADQSGVLFTALAFAKPLLLSDAGGFPEIAATGAAECVPAGDAPALAAALERLIADPARREEMSERARAAAAPGGALSWESVARHHLALYERLLRRESPSTCAPPRSSSGSPPA